MDEGLVLMIKGKRITVRDEVRVDGDTVYSYSLTQDERELNLGFGFPLYSIYIKMHDTLTGKTTDASAEELFASEEKALRFFEKLVRNLATPIDLAYVVEDEFS